MARYKLMYGRFRWWLLPLVFCAIFVLSGCVPPPPPSAEGGTIVGSWLWTKTDQRRNTVEWWVLQFSADGIAQMWPSGNLNDEGPYTYDRVTGTLTVHWQRSGDTQTYPVRIYGNVMSINGFFVGGTAWLQKIDEGMYLPLPTEEPTAEPVEESPPAPEPSQSMAKAHNGNVNIRSGPSLNYNAIGTLSNGESEPITGRNADSTWWQIQFDGNTGWVAASVTELVNPNNVEIPVVEAPPSEDPKDQLVVILNDYRAQYACTPLERDPTLDEAAQNWAAVAPCNLMEAQYACHSAHAYEIMADVGPSGQVGAEGALNFWKSSKPHDDMLKINTCSFAKVGVGLAPTGTRKTAKACSYIGYEKGWCYDWVWVVQFGP